MNSRERVFAMLDGEPVDHLPLMPITMMFASRQIGRKYREYVTDHRVMVEAQIRTAERFHLDQVSGISDPAREASDLGASVQFFDDQPPAMIESGAFLSDKTRLVGLKIPDPLGGGRMHDRVQAMALFWQKVGKDKVIEGWIEGPCNQAANLRGINTLMLDFIDDPPFVHDLMAFVVEMELGFGRAQVETGADLIGIGDPASSLVGPRIFEEFIFPYQKKLVDGIRALGARVRLHICGNTRRSLTELARLRPDVLDVDSMVPMPLVREKMGPDQVLLGGIDPVRTLSLGTPELVEEKVRECHDSAGPRYVVGAGCEVPPETPAENMMALTSYAREHAAEPVKA